MARAMLSSTVPGTRTLSGCITAACTPAAKILAGLVITDIGQCIEKVVYERCSSPLSMAMRHRFDPVQTSISFGD